MRKLKHLLYSNQVSIKASPKGLNVHTNVFYEENIFTVFFSVVQVHVSVLSNLSYNLIHSNKMPGYFTDYQ